jgi:hypothetical protein
MKLNLPAGIGQLEMWQWFPPLVALSARKQRVLRVTEFETLVFSGTYQAPILVNERRLKAFFAPNAFHPRRRLQSL